MELRQMRYFVAIAEAGSIMKASRRLHVAQPALSAHLASLEIELGTKLFIRSSRGVELTTDGASLYEHTASMLRQQREYLKKLGERKKRPSGTVSLGLVSSVPGRLCPHLYQMLRDELPNVTLYLVEASSAIIYEWLLDGKIDLAILCSLPEVGRVELTPLYMEEVCLVGVPQSIDRQDQIEFNDIFDYPLVMPGRSTSWRQTLDQVAAQRGKILKPAIETESFSALRSIALSGLGCAILPRSSVQKEVAEGRLCAYKIINPDLCGQMSIASLHQVELSRTVAAVRELLLRAVTGVKGEPPLQTTPTATAHVIRVPPAALFPIEAQRLTRAKSTH